MGCKACYEQLLIMHHEIKLVIILLFHRRLEVFAIGHKTKHFDYNGRYGMVYNKPFYTILNS